jgi:hypothetical protein
MDRPARTLSGSLMHHVLSHAYGWVPIMAHLFLSLGVGDAMVLCRSNLGLPISSE